MADLYNMSFLDNSTNPVELITGIGTAVGQPFLIGHLILVSFFLIFLILSYRMDFQEVLIIDGFITTILAILFYIAGLIPVTSIIYPMMVFIITLLFFLFNNR